MKKRRIMESMRCFKAAMMLALGALVFTACSDDDDDDDMSVPEAVRSAFTQKYGNVGVDWDLEGQYFVAEFRKDSREHEAWFTTGGVWNMTTIDYGKSITGLPSAVQEGFNASPYTNANGWIIDDVDKIERSNYDDVFKIEVEQRGNPEKDLYFDANGNLFREAAGHDNRNEGMLQNNNGMPAEIKGQVDEKYPNARIVDFEFERNQYEVELIFNNQSIEMVFDNSYKWVKTLTDMKRQIPSDVKKAVNAKYPDKRIDDCDLVETADGEKYYLVDLDNHAMDLKVSEDGSSIEEVHE